MEKGKVHLDSQDMLSVILKLPQQMEEAYQLGSYVKISKPIKRIIILGMGGSAVGGMLLQNYVEKELSVPLIVVRSYELPKFVDSESLVFACSYSGNTEETLSAYQEARKKSCLIVAVTSGGKLMQMADADHCQIIAVPKGMQPRAATPYFFFPILQVLENARMIPAQLKLVKEAAAQLRKPGFEKIAKDLCEKLYEKIPIIYASSMFSAVAYRWQTQFNENTKIIAHHHEFSEMNHNELMGIEHPQGNVHILLLKSSLDHRRIQKRMQLCEKLFRETATLTIVNLKDADFLTAMFSALHIGDLTSYFLALRYRRDPSPVLRIEQFKKDMGPMV